MDGVTLLRELQQFIHETSTSTWAKCKTGYDYLYQAAVATAARTGIFTSSQTITTVANQANYTLNSDFLRLYLVDDLNRYVVKYYNTASYSFPRFTSYDAIYLNNHTTSVSVPNKFTIKDAAAGTIITDTVTSNGAFTSGYTIFNEALGESTLTDSGGGLGSVNIGDAVHNTTDKSNGYVVALSSATAVVTALFNGTLNYWTSADGYKIIPQHRFEIYMDPPPLTAGHSIYVPYVRRPDPVYSGFRTYNFPSGLSNVLVHYAAWLYKYRDREPSFGDGFYQYWDYQCNQFVKNLGMTEGRDLTFRNKIIMDNIKKEPQAQKEK